MTESGNFDTLFHEQGTGESLEIENTAAGLFQWLYPGDTWDVGTCVGYSTSALAIISDPIFEASRFLIVMAIVLGGMATCWVLSMACLMLGVVQIWILGGLQLLQVILVSFAFLVKQSGLCHNVGQDTSCRLDEGGAMAIAAAILWFVTFLVTVFYVKSPHKRLDDLIQAMAEELAEKKRKKAVEKRKRKEARQRLIDEEMAVIPSTPPRVSESQASAPEAVVSFNETDGEMEVYYIAARLNRIEAIIDED